MVTHFAFSAALAGVFNPLGPRALNPQPLPPRFLRSGIIIIGG